MLNESNSPTGKLPAGRDGGKQRTPMEVTVTAELKHYLSVIGKPFIHENTGEVLGTIVNTSPLELKGTYRVTIALNEAGIALMKQKFENHLQRSIGVNL